MENTDAAEHRKFRRLIMERKRRNLDCMSSEDIGNRQINRDTNCIVGNRSPLSDITAVTPISGANKKTKFGTIPSSNCGQQLTFNTCSNAQKSQSSCVPTDHQNIVFSSSSTSIPIADLLSEQNTIKRVYKENRKDRKLLLDNKRRKASTSSNVQHASGPRFSNLTSTSNSYSYETSPSVSIPTSNVSQPMTLDKSAGQVHSNASVQKNLSSRFSSVRPFPMGLLLEEEIIKGVSKDYLDHGDQNVICQMCHSKLWKVESQRNNNTQKKNAYSLCCGQGKVQLPELKEPPETYRILYSGVGDDSKYFLKNIRRYNSMFSFTSMGGKIDTTINKGNAPFVYRLSGQNYHCIGSLLPSEGCRPKFSQLYIYDTDNEVENRQSIFSSSENAASSKCDTVDNHLIQYLKMMLDSNNELVKVYRMVRNSFQHNPQVDLKLRLIGKRNKDGRTYNLSTASEVAALIVGDITDCIESRDIIVTTKSGRLQRISELHPSYLALQYPLLFPFGDDGYRVDIPHRNRSDLVTTRNARCTMREFFAFRIQDRVGKFSLILNSRRLLQQFLVDAYTMIESERLYFIRNQQKVLRCETYENLRSAQRVGNTELSNTGQRIILPSSFTGGARYMMQNYLDAMTLCKFFGFPDIFLTITCNPKWPEVRRFLQDSTINPEDRPDVLCRIFKIKLDSLIKDLKENALFGKVQAVVYTVEFQKRGLPHAHICLFMHPADKLHTVDLIDPIISAEIPNKEEDPELYTLVSDFMIHGPCGANNMKCPCMVDKKCSKKFPKKFRENTSTDADGYPLYRRRDYGMYVTKCGVRLDNRSVVPYNKTLLKRYQAHINVEWCNQAGSIKYLFKYINKGPDRVTMSVGQGDNENSNEDEVDEIKEYYDCRYISACEASWRIYGFDVHYRTPPVMRLPFHLPGKQSIVYGADDDVDNVLNKHSVASSMFLSWMECNKEYADAKTLTYVEFPTKFVWHLDKRCWKPRKMGFSLGRIHAVSPSLGEAYFLRILLNKVKGPRSFEEIRTVNEITYDTYRDACYALGLLDDDKEYIEAIKEASVAGHGPYLRSLFASMLLTHSVSRPVHVWENTWRYLSDDILHTQQVYLNAPDLSLTEDQIKNLTLFEIEKILLRNNSTLHNFKPIPYPNHESIDSANNVLMNEELAYDLHDLQDEFHRLHSALTDEQRSIYETITEVVNKDEGGMFFVYGYGGTGKTFLWKTLSASIRRNGQIVLNVASSGIASLLLTGGRTAHSRFIIPINLHEDSICKIDPNSDLHNLLKSTKLIIWDEAPMIHKHGVEALDKSMNDLFNNGRQSVSSKPFGGKVVVFGGDFRQILPVIQNGSRQDIVNASLCSSYLWSKCQVLRLTKNMRLTTGNDADSIEQTRLFSQWLLDLGEGKVGGPNDGEAMIDIPDDLLINNSFDPVADLIEFVYPSILEKVNDPHFFQDRALLAPTNEVVDEINDKLLAMFPGQEKEYLSSDSISQSEYINEDFDDRLYSPDYLNGLKASGMPNHRLVLKVGVPIMLLRNIDQKKGLCNGTRLQVISLHTHVIEARVISGSNIDDRCFIPRLSITPSDKKIALQFKRRQFPVVVCFAMTINKSQGQSLERVGLYLKQPVFSHGQLYVAFSRVKTRDGLKILILDGDNNPTNSTMNVVYKEVFRHL